jgi:hypothetical protein
MHYYLFKFILISNSVPFGNLIFKLLIVFSKTFLCSVSALQLKTLLLDTHQLLMLSTGTLTYLEQTVSFGHIL